MPLDFIDYVERGLRDLDAGGRPHVASVHNLDDADFITLPPAQRAELFRCAERFREIAGAADVDPSQGAEAREALARVWELLRPYRTPESRRVCAAVWEAWKREGAQEWAATFDYQLEENSIGQPAVWVWLVLTADPFAPRTREDRNRFELLVRVCLQNAGVERYPYFQIRRQEEVTRPAAGAPA